MPRKASTRDGREGLPEQVKAKLETLLDFQRICAGAVNDDGTLKPEGWRALMYSVGMTPAILADALRITPSAVSAVIGGHKRSRKVELTLAEFFQLNPERVWGRK